MPWWDPHGVGNESSVFGRNLNASRPPRRIHPPNEYDIIEDNIQGV